MKLSSALLATGSAWECLRFGLAALLVFAPSGSQSYSYASVIWFASPQLIVAGMLLMLALYRERYAKLFGMVILAKLLASSSGAAAVVPALLIQGGQLQLTSDGAVVGIIVIGDLLLLGVLLTLRPSNTEQRAHAERRADSEESAQSAGE